MAKHHKCPEHVNHERWLVSYADFITLLFAFFTVLYAISNTDAKKVEKFVGAAERAFNLAPFTAGSESVVLTELTASSGEGVYDMALRMTDVEKNLKDSLGQEAEDGKITVEKVPGGLLITLKTFGFFKSGSDELHPGATEVLLKIGDELGKIPNSVRVDGHTDDTPIHRGRFRSNWELSSARAVAVLSGLLAAGVSPSRFSVTGFSSYKPVASNETVHGRALNRRVEIFVIAPDEAPERYPLLGKVIETEN